MELNIKLIKDGEFFQMFTDYVASDATSSSKGCRRHNEITKRVKKVVLWKDVRKNARHI